MTRIAFRHCPYRETELLRQSGVHPVLARLYAARGVADLRELSSELAGMMAPAGLLHIDAAAVFLADAIDAQKKLVIVADYDCDGATACAVALRGLRMMGAKVDFIVPNRFEYGYGLTPEIVELTVREKSPDVIVTVDNGIASIDGVAEANRRGIEVVVTDHHLPADRLPAARVIVNPNQPECGFPSKPLAGVGVMFYVLLALRAESRRHAAGRLADMSRGIDCLSTDDDGRAWAIAQDLDAINRDRRSIEADMQDTALAMLESVDPQDKATISVFDHSWHQGVIGILASRIKDKYYRPTITFAPAGEGLIKGSGRSIAGFHLRDALDLVSKHAPGLLEKFGGHAMAAGLTIRAEAFDAFSEAFEKVGRASLAQSELERVIETDGPLEDAYFTPQFIELLDTQVWGQ